MIEFLLLASWTTAQKPCSKRVTGKAISLFDSYCHSIDPSKMCINRPIGGHIVNYLLSQNWDVNPEDVLQRGTKSCPFSWLTIYVSHDRNFKLAKRKTLLPPPSIHFLYSCLQSITKGDLWSYLAWLNLCDSYLVEVNPSQLSNSLLVIFFFLCSALILIFKTRQTNRLH